MAAATLVLAACGSGSEGTVEPADSTTRDAMASTEPSPEAMVEESADAEAPAMEAAEQLQFTSTLLADGAAFDGASLAGKDTILWFWAPWCPTCQNEAPSIAAASLNLPDGVTIIGVPGQSDVGAMQAFTAEYGLGGIDHLVDEDGSLWSGFGVAYQPAFAFINDDGTVTTVPGSMSEQGLLDAANELAAN